MVSVMCLWHVLILLPSAKNPEEAELEDSLNEVVGLR